MKIIQVVRRLHPNGGASGVAWFLKREFDKLGVENDVITQGESDNRPRSRRLEKLRLMIDVVAFSIIGSLKLRRVRRRSVVSIVHNDAIGGDIYVDHGLHKGVVAQKPGMLLRNPLHSFLLIREEIRHRLNTYDKMVSLSDYSSKEIERHYPMVKPATIVTIPNGVDFERFDIQRVTDNRDEFRLIFVGHEFERKGLRFVIESLSYLPERVTLSVVGGTDDEIRKYNKLSRSNGTVSRVQFLGRRSDVPQLLSSHDVLVCPSRFESWLLVLVEAMAGGVVVLSTPVGCAPQVIREGENGFLIEASGVDIAEKVKVILSRPDELLEMRKKAKETAMEYSWTRVANRYIELAREILISRGEI